MTDIKTLSELDIENLHFQLCTMNDDEAFQLKLFEIVHPILLEISANNSNRVKLMEIICSINNRIRVLKQITHLKLEPFIELYKNDNLSYMSLNFVQMYIKICFPKLTMEYKMKLLPLLLSTITPNRPQAAKDLILHIILPNLQFVKSSDFLIKNKFFEISNSKYLRKYLWEFLSLIMMMPYNYRSYIQSNTESENVRVPDGMNNNDFQRAIKSNITCFLVNDDLERVKVGIVGFLCNLIGNLTTNCEIFDELVVLISISHGDTRHAVISALDKDAKLLYSKINFDKESILNALFDWLIPRRREFDADIVSNSTSNLSCNRSRMSIPIQMKMIQLLFKSKITLPNQFQDITTALASMTFLDVDKSIHAKLVDLGFALVIHLCSFASSLTDQNAEKLLSSIIEFMEKSLEQHEVGMKCKALTLFPLILQRNSTFLRRDVSYLGQLFESLANESISKEVRQSFNQCITGITGIISSNLVFSQNPQLPEQMHQLLHYNYNKTSDQYGDLLKCTVVRCAGKLFNSQDLPSRFLLLEALSNKSVSVKEAAADILYTEIFQEDAQWKILTQQIKLPSFIDAVNYYNNVYCRNIKNDFLKFMTMVKYLRLCLLSVSPDDSHDKPIGHRPTNHLQQQEILRSRIVCNLKYLSAGSERLPTYVETYCQLIQLIYCTKNGYNAYMEEVILAVPQQLMPRTSTLLNRTKILMSIGYGSVASSDDEEGDPIHSRISAANIFTDMFCGQINQSQKSEMYDVMVNYISEVMLSKSSSSISTIKPEDASQLEGVVIAAARIVESVNVQDHPELVPIKERLVTLLESVLLPDREHQYHQLVIKQPDTSRHIQLVLAAFSALQSLVRARVIPFSMVEDSTPTSQHSFNSGAAITELCIYWSKQCLNNRVKEESLALLGNYCRTAAVEDPVSIALVLDSLIGKLSGFKHATVHYQVSGVLQAICGSHSVFGLWYEYELQQSSSRCNNALKVLGSMEGLLDGASLVVRGNILIWLEGVLQYLLSGGGDPEPELSEVCFKLHARSMSLLADSGSNVAAKVLALLYQLGVSGRTQMTLQLTQMLTASVESNNLTGGQLDAKMSKLWIYRELCKFTKEISQPQLIYQLLPLVQSSSTASNATAASTNPSTPAAPQLDLHSASGDIAAKLFRYRHHPNYQMSQLFSNQSSIKLSLDRLGPIVKDISDNLGSNSSTTRICCCRALSSLLSQHSADLVDNLSRLQNTFFEDLLLPLTRNMDDSHQEAREAAMETCATFIKFCSNLLDLQQQHRNLPAFINQLVVTILEHQLLQNNVDSVRVMSVQLLTAIVATNKHATILKQHASRLVLVILQTLSGENQESQWDYVEQHLAVHAPESMDKFDQQRVNILGKSPSADLITNLVPYVVPSEVGVPLADLIRCGVGLTTRHACAQLVRQMASSSGDLGSVSGKLLAALLQSCASGRHRVLQKQIARAISALVPHSKTSSVEKLLGLTRDWYFSEYTNQDKQWALAFIYSAIEQDCPGTLYSFSTTTSAGVSSSTEVSPLALVFIAKQMDSEPSLSPASSSENLNTEDICKRKVLWSELWLEIQTSSPALHNEWQLLTNTPGNCILLEMLPQLNYHSLQSNFHGIKVQIALSYRTIIRLMNPPPPPPSSTNETSSRSATTNHVIIISVGRHLTELICVGGAVWPGKVYLLHALMALVRKLHQNQLLSFVWPDQSHKQLIEVLTNQSRGNKSGGGSNDSAVNYRTQALETVAKLSEIFNEDCLDSLLGDLIGMDQRFATVAKDSNNADGATTTVAPTQSVVSAGSSKTTDKAETFVRIVGHLWPHAEFAQSQQSHFLTVIQYLTTSMEEGTWKLQTQALKTYKAIFTKMDSSTIEQLLCQQTPSQADSVTKAMHQMLKSWRRTADLSKYKLLRESCLDATEILVNKPEFHPVLKDALKNLLASFQNDSVLTIKDKANQLLRKL